MLNPNEKIYQLEREDLNKEEKIALEYIFNGANVLEVGCNAGRFSEMIKEANKDINIVGNDIDYRVANRAEKYLDKLIIGSIEEKTTFSEVVELGEYDIILLLHVIEHLVDPWLLLEKIRKILKNGGRIICAVPNISNWNTRALLFFKGKWEYEDKGVMDITHLRFFTYDSLVGLFNNIGYQIENTYFLYPVIPIIDNIKIAAIYRHYFTNIISRFLSPKLWATVILLVATK